MLEAVYYEKKSDRGEDLGKFGLAPLGVAGTPNIRIELQDADGNSLTAFNVGRYDLDVGRGAKAAYIKFDNRFQVWLIAADFIDLEPVWQNWTYSSLWNLRFGRLAAVNGQTDAGLLANLARIMLNTYFTGEAPEKQMPKNVRFHAGRRERKPCRFEILSRKRPLLCRLRFHRHNQRKTFANFR